MAEEQKSQDRRVKKTENAIYEAFQSLLQEKKYSEITVKEVTERADITRKTFYLHYGSLDDVLREFVSELMYGIREEIFSPESVRRGLLDESEETDYSELFSRINQNFSREHQKVRNLMSDDVSRQVVYQFLMERQKRLWENYQKQYELEPGVAKLYGTFTTYGFIAMYMSWYTDSDSDSDSISLDEFAKMTRDITAGMQDILKKWKKPA